MSTEIDFKLDKGISRVSSKCCILALLQFISQKNQFLDKSIDAR